MYKKENINFFKLTLPAISENESFSRSLISSFISRLDPTVEELCDLKTAVSEAVTNCIVHAYPNSCPMQKRLIYIKGQYDLEKNLITVKISDKGQGIENIEKAMEPMYTSSQGDERSGMGFSIMQCFTDKLSVKSTVGKGTTVTLKKYIGKYSEESN